MRSCAGGEPQWQRQTMSPYGCLKNCSAKGDTLDHATAVEQIQRRFGKEFIHENEKGNAAIRRDVLPYSEASLAIQSLGSHLSSVAQETPIRQTRTTARLIVMTARLAPPSSRRWGACYPLTRPWTFCQFHQLVQTLKLIQLQFQRQRYPLQRRMGFAERAAAAER